MENNGKDEEKKAIPPYVSYKTFRNFVDRLRVGLPSRIDRSLMGSLSGAAQSYLMSAMVYLRLISQNGIPTEKLSRLVNSEGSEGQKALRDILVGAYPFLFSERFDLKTTTVRHLEEQFSNAGASGGTVRKCVAFFLAAAKDAGVEVSPYITKSAKGMRGTQKGRRASVQGQNSGRIDIPPPIDPSTPAGWSQSILSKFPAFDPAWPDDVKVKWFDAFDKLMRMGQQQKEENS